MSFAASHNLATLKLMLINLPTAFIGLLKDILILLLSGLRSTLGNSDHYNTENRPSPLLVTVPIEFLVESTKEQTPVMNYCDILERLGSHADHGEICAVCLTCMKKGDEVREIPTCLHVFHRECLDAWIDKGKSTCPLCRSETIMSHQEEKTEKLKGTGRDPWRKERMIYLFGEDVTF